MILENGLIRTLDPLLPTARAIAIAGERIAGGVGTHERALASPERVDLRGLCVVPGLNDAHVHLVGWALARQELALDGLGLEQSLERVSQAAAQASPDSWIRARGIAAEALVATVAMRSPRQELDTLVGARPALVVARDGHTAWGSSAALALLRAPIAGVERGPDGEPTGLLREQAVRALSNGPGRPDEDELVAALRDAAGELLARGVTAVHDFDGALALPALQRLQLEGGFQLRVLEALPHERLPELERLGLRSGFGDGRLRLGALKIFLDGTLGSGTAARFPEEGWLAYGSDELEEIVRHASACGWPVALHTIGERAVAVALDALERTRDVWAPLRLRPRLEHVQFARPADIDRLAVLGVAASVQFAHASTDRDLADRALLESQDVLAYPYRSLAEAGVLLAGGSDAPVEELSPLTALKAAVTRTLDERPPWRAEEALEIGRALDALTAGAAALAGDGRERGRLLPGLLADLVVLDRDPLSTPGEELDRIAVVATMLAGSWVHGGPPF